MLCNDNKRPVVHLHDLIGLRASLAKAQYLGPAQARLDTKRQRLLLKCPVGSRTAGRITLLGGLDCEMHDEPEETIFLLLVGTD
jgi:hypothetical protein